MFGLGKKKSEAAEKPSKKSSGRKAGAGIPWKAWLINHGEKIGLALFGILAIYYIYEGLMTKPYDRTKNPELLASRSQEVKRKIETDPHWPDIKDQKERAKPNDFRKVVDDARNPTQPDPYGVDHIVVKGLRPSGEKRGDPELLAPRHVHGSCFVGSIAVYSPTPSALDKLLNAPPLGDPKKRRETPNASTPPRQLNPFFDRGFQPGVDTTFPVPSPTPVVGRTVRPVVYSMVPKLSLFNAVTAIVPHQELDSNYRKALGSANGFDLNRDTPNYLHYEVQRVDVTDNPNREVQEADWKDAPDCMFDRQMKERATWAGLCAEYVPARYVHADVLTMPVPPILLSDYSSYATHPILAASTSEAQPASGESSGEGEEGPSRRTFSSPVNYGSADATSTPAPEPDAEVLPQAVEASEFKLIRFFDFGVEGIGRVYRYRVRLALEDPNYTRAESVSPATIDMRPEIVPRIQALVDADLAAKEKLAPGQVFKRNSKLLTSWSDPSPPIVASLPIHLTSSGVTGLFSRIKAPGGREVVIEQLPAVSPVIYGEWKRDDAVLVTRRLIAERGSVLSGPPTANEPGLDIVHPVTKIIKWLTGFRFSQPMTIADIRGGHPLEAERRPTKDKDPLPSQGEVVGYDPRTGELVISREFESRDGFSMFSFVGETQAVVGGGLGDDAN